MFRYKNPRLKNFKIKSARNALIDFYLNGFRRRETNTERPCVVFFNYLTLICYTISIIKLLICFMPLSRTTKLILFDPGVIYGGIEVYNRIFLLCGVLLGAMTNISLRITKGSAYKEWTFVFEAARNRSLIMVFGDRNMLAKIVKVMRVQYKIMNIGLVYFSK